MIKRTQQILIGLVAVQIILAVIVFWPRGAVATTGAPLLGSLKATDITAIAIRDDKGVNVKLTRSGEQWVVADSDDFPVQAGKVQPVLDKLVAVKTSRLATQTAASHRRLQVADDTYARKIDLTTNAAPVTLYLGTSAGGTNVHVRLAGQDQVYVASDLATYTVNADAASWIDAAYQTVLMNDIVSLNLVNANGTFSFSRPISGTWSMAGLAAGEILDQQAVTNTLSLLTNLRMTRPLGKTEKPEYGLATPTATVTFKTSQNGGEQTIVLKVGSLDTAENAYSIKSSMSPYFVRAAAWSVQELTQKARTAFLKLPPTPAPAAPPQK